MTWYSECINIDMFRHSSLHIACEGCIPCCVILSFDGLYVYRRLINVCMSGTEKKEWTERILKVNSKEIVTDCYFSLPEIELRHC